MKPGLQDEFLSVVPLSDSLHAREIARETVANYRAMSAARLLANLYQTLRPRALSQADIDRVEIRTTVNYTRRAVKWHRVSLLRRFLNLFR